MWVWDDRTQGWTDVEETVSRGARRTRSDGFGPPPRTPARVVRGLGGIATTAQLGGFTRREIAQSVKDDELIRLGRGKVALPSVGQAASTAASFGGVLCLTSAALHHGWPVMHTPERPHVLFGKHRRLDPGVRQAVSVHWRDLGPTDSDAIATSPVLTLTQCFRMLPEVEALAVADSAARSGAFEELAEVASTAKGPRAPRIRHLASSARAEARNPFESALRGLAERARGAHFEPQVPIGELCPTVTPDLVERGLKIVLEADSFEWHGGRAALRRDARRYNALVGAGWLVLRFSWEDVMFEQAAVVAAIDAAVWVRTRGWTDVTAGAFRRP